jgi:hypothetical protein
MAKSGKRSKGSVRAKLGLPAKAGRRRPPHLRSEIDKHGKRQWFAV